MAAQQHLDLGLSTRIIDTLQRHASRDEVELVVDLGIAWATIEPVVDALVRDGYLIVRESDGEQVFELARSSNRRSLADLLSA